MASGIRHVAIDAGGVDIHVTLRGNGPLVLLLPGAAGLQTGYAALIKLLSADHTVAVYDRRGHGRGKEKEPSIAPLSIEQHAIDAAALVDALDEGPAHVVGSSAGAVIGVELLARHPDRLRSLVAHEPSLLPLIEDGPRWRTWYEDLVAIDRQVGTRAAFDYFFAHLASNGRGEQAQVTIPDSQLTEWSVYFQRELIEIVSYEPDLKQLAQRGDVLVPPLGADSRERWHGRVVLELAARVGVPAVEVAGGHLSPVYQPLAFHRLIRDNVALTERGA
jgi:pimeloyl-ACP methyl ester carboxylesterase